MRAGLLVGVLLGAACQDPCRDGRICTIAGTGELGFNDDGPATEHKLASPTSVAVDGEGRTLIADYSNMLIRVVDEGSLRTVVGVGLHAYSELGVPALDTPLENPVDVAVGPDGLLYVLPQHEGRVIRIRDGLTERVVGTGAIGDTGDGGPAIEATLGYTAGLAFAPDGSLFISDQSHSRVRRVDPEGRISTVIGLGQAGSGLGPGLETGLRSPERLALRDDGLELLVADAGNHRVLALSVPTGLVRLVAGAGERGYSGDGGPGSEALLNAPTGVLYGPSGSVLIADLGNDVLRRVDADGTIETLAGNPGEVEARRSEPAETAILRGPAGLAWSHEGDLLIAERTGQRVRRWNGAWHAM